MKKFSLRSIILGIGIAVIVPLICFLILRMSGHTGHVKVPGNYGIDTVIQKEVSGSIQYDTVYHRIGNTCFVSHLNKKVDLSKDYPRETLVLNFYTTQDDSASNKLTYHMRRIQAGFKLKKHDTAIQLISIATQPMYDSVASMRAYANDRTMDHDTWTFITAPQEDIKRFAMEDLFIDYNWEAEQSNFPKQIVLIDKYRNIRGYYNGLDSMEIKRCIDDVALLMVEKNKIHEKRR